MKRSSSERLFGGICGGLAAKTPLNAWTWRALFTLAAVLTGGLAAVLYLLWWWLLPLEGFNTRQPLATPLAVLAAVLLLAIGLAGGALLWAWVGVLLAAAFALRQLFLPQRHLLWGVVALVLAVGALLAGYGTLPASLVDTLARLSAGVLLFLGFSLALLNLPRWGDALALLLTLAIVGGLTAAAFNARAGSQRNENVVEGTDRIGESVTTLQLNIEALDTDVQVFSAPPDVREVRYRYTGSTANLASHTYDEDGSIATFTLVETRTTPFPRLDEVGRAALVIEVPRQLAVAIAFVGQSGLANFDLAALDLERLNLDLMRGDAVVSLPTYQPLSPSVAQQPGELIVRSGSLRLLVAEEVGAQFWLNKATNRRPQYDDLLYALEDNLNEWRLVARNVSTAPVKIRYVLTVPNGQIRLDNTTGG